VNRAPVVLSRLDSPSSEKNCISDYDFVLLNSVDLITGLSCTVEKQPDINHSIVVTRDSSKFGIASTHTLRHSM